MKKHILLAIGVAAIYMAAKEYGINSIDDLKKVLKPYLGALDMDEISNLLKDDSHSAGSPSSMHNRLTGVPHES
jgi:hypothetical protein